MLRDEIAIREVRYEFADPRFSILDLQQMIYINSLPLGFILRSGSFALI